jgi:hypothetical protein
VWGKKEVPWRASTHRGSRPRPVVAVVAGLGEKAAAARVFGRSPAQVAHTAAALGVQEQGQAPATTMPLAEVAVADDIVVPGGALVGMGGRR